MFQENIKRLGTELLVFSYANHHFVHTPDDQRPSRRFCLCYFAVTLYALPLEPSPVAPTLTLDRSISTTGRTA